MSIKQEKGWASHPWMFSGGLAPDLPQLTVPIFMRVSCLAEDPMSSSDRPHMVFGSARAGSAGRRPLALRQPSDRQEDSEKDGIGARRTARHENVNGQELIHAARARVAASDNASRRGARADGDHHAGLGDGFVGPANGHLQVAGHRTGDDDAVGMARRGHEIDAQPADVIDRIQQRREFPVAGIARSGIQMAQMQGAPQGAPNGVGDGLRQRVRRAHHGPILGSALGPDDQVLAFARRQFERVAQLDRAVGRGEGAAAAEDAPGNVDFASLGVAGDGAGRTDRWRRQKRGRPLEVPVKHKKSL